MGFYMHKNIHFMIFREINTIPKLQASFLNPFLANVSRWHLNESLWFSCVFEEYIKETWQQKG